MADEDLGNQLKIQQQINNVLAKRQKMLLDQVQTLGAQAKMAKEICKGLECKELDGMDERINSINGGLKDVRTRTDELNGALDQTGKNANKAAKGIFNMSNAVKAAALVGFAGGVVSAFKGALTIIKNVISAAVTLVKTIYNIGKAVVSIPFQVMEGLSKMAAKTHDMLIPVREAVQDIVREFGSLSSNEGKAVIGTFKTLQKQSKTLAKAGISLGNAYGIDEAGAAARLKAMNEMGKAAGAGIHILSKDIKENSIVLDVMRRTIGLTAEQQAFMGLMAKKSGKSMLQAQKDFHEAAIAAGVGSKISSKVIGKAMGEIISDFEEFGEMAPEALANTAAFALKLGVEIKSLKGLLKFDNFETAAKSAAKLAGAFGINVDAMKLMRTQDVAERLKYLQQQFKASGKTIEGMSRIGFKNLSSALGDMDRKTIELAFSNEGLNLSYEKIKNATKDNKKEGRSTEQILSDVADNLGKVVHKMEKEFKGFFDAFKSGFLDGIFRSKEMRGMLVNLASALRQTFYAGREVGYMFMALFPGVSDMAGALKEFFSPKVIGRLLSGIKDAFRQLFLDLQADPNSGFEGFIHRLRIAFSNFFATNGYLYNILVEGAQTALTALSGLAAQLVDFIVPQIATGLGHLADFLRTGSFDTLRAVGGWWTDIMDPLLTSLENNLPILGSALGDFFTVAWDLAKPHVMAGLKEFGKWLLYYMGAVIVFSTGKAVVSTVLAGIVSSMLFGGAIGTPGMAAAQTAEMRTVIGGLATMSTGEIARASANLAIIGTILLVALGGAVTVIAMMIKGAKVSLEQVGSAAIALIGITGSIALMAYAATALAGISEGSIFKATSAMIAIGVFTGVLGLAAVGLASLMKCVPITAVAAFAGMMVTLVGSIVAIAFTAKTLGLAFAGPQALIAGPALLAGMVVLGKVSLAVVGFATAFILAFKSFNPSDMDNAVKASTVTFDLMKTVVMVAAATLASGMSHAFTAIAVGRDPVADGLRTLEGVTKIMQDFLPKIIKNIVKALEGVNVEETKATVQAVESVMNALSPMINVTAALGQTAAGLASAQRDNPVDPQEIKEVLKTVQDGMSSVFTGVQDVVNTIVSSLTELTPGQIKAASAAAPVMKATGAMLSAIMGPVNTVLKGARDIRDGIKEGETLFMAADYERRDYGISADKVKDTMKALGETLPGVMKSMGAAVTSIMGAIKEFTITESEGKNISRVAKIMRPAGQAVLNISKAMSGFMEMLKSLGGEKWNDYPVLFDSINTMGMLLTGGSGFYLDEDGNEKAGTRVTTSGLLPIIKGMITFFDGVTITGNLQTLKAKSEAIAGVVSAIGAVTGTLGGAISTLFGSSAKKHGIDSMSATTIANTVLKAKMIVDGMIAAGFGETGFVKDLMDKIYSFGDDAFGKGGIKKVRFVAKKAKLIGEIMGVIPTLTTMVTSIKTMQKMIGPSIFDSILAEADPEAAANKFNNPIQSLWDNTISKFFGEDGKIGPLELILSHMQQVASIIKEPKKLSSRVSAMSSAFDAVGRMSTLLQRFGSDPQEGNGKPPPPSAYTAAQKGASRLATILSNENFTKVINRVKLFAGKGDMSLPNTTQSKYTIARLKHMSLAYAEMQKVLEGKSSGDFSKMVNDPDFAANFVKNINNINKVFKETGGIQSVAAKLNEGGTIEVKHSLRNVQMHIAVHIDSQQLVKELYDVSAMTVGKGNQKAQKRKLNYVLATP